MGMVGLLPPTKNGPRHWLRGRSCVCRREIRSVRARLRRLLAGGDLEHHDEADDKQHGDAHDAQAGVAGEGGEGAHQEGAQDGGVLAKDTDNGGVKEDDLRRAFELSKIIYG